MTSFISNLHNDLRQARLTRRGKTGGKEAKNSHKVYRRMEQIPLPKPVPLNYSLNDALANRYSTTHTSTHQKPLTVKELGTLFGHALGCRAKSTHRHYPSGGALYPIETYLITSTIEGAEPGIFHYNPTDHSLERLWDIPQNLSVSTLIRGGPEGFTCSSIIVFTSVWGRSAAKYGDFTYILALLEAGHMSENILLTATALGIGTRPFAGFDDKKIAELLDLNDAEEQTVQTIALMKPANEKEKTSVKEFHEE